MAEAAERTDYVVGVDLGGTKIYSGVFDNKVVDEAAGYVGIAVANLINLFNPEVVVLGGGVIEALEGEMMPTIVKTARQRSLSGTDQGVQIVATQSGDNAGIIGGAVLARQKAREADKS